jgi:hypothetical protein
MLFQCVSMRFTVFQCVSLCSHVCHCVTLSSSVFLCALLCSGVFRCIPLCSTMFHTNLFVTCLLTRYDQIMTASDSRHVAVRKTLSDLQADSRCRRQTLGDMLMLPVQHIMRWVVWAACLFVCCCDCFVSAFSRGLNVLEICSISLLCVYNFQCLQLSFPRHLLNTVM